MSHLRIANAPSVKKTEEVKDCQPRDDMHIDFPHELLFLNGGNVDVRTEHRSQLMGGSFQSGSFGDGVRVVHHRPRGRRGGWKATNSSGPALWIDFI